METKSQETRITKDTFKKTLQEKIDLKNAKEKYKRSLKENQRQNGEIK